MLSVSNTVVAYTQSVFDKSVNNTQSSDAFVYNTEELKSPIITSTRVLLLNAMSVLNIMKKEINF